VTVEWPDVSHYQAGLSLHGALLVFPKATQGTSWVDPAYAGFKAQALGLGIPCGAYHWLDTSDPVAQARHAYTVVGPGVALMVDDEQPRISVPHTLAFVAAYRQLGGLVRLEYLPRWAWEASGSPDLRPLAAAGLLLVASDYNPADNTAGGKAWQPYGGWKPSILQVTDKKPFNGRPVDFNTYPGTLAQLLALLNPSTHGDDMNLTDTFKTASGETKTVDNFLGDGYDFIQNGRGPFGAYIHTQFTALAAGNAALKAAVDHLGAVIQSGGGNVDLATINTHIDSAVAAAVAQVKADLHAAAQAEADTLT
jgi:hypothetical protein